MDCIGGKITRVEIIQNANGKLLRIKFGQILNAASDHEMEQAMIHLVYVWSRKDAFAKSDIDRSYVHLCI